MATPVGIFLDVNIENTNRGFMLAGTTGKPTQLASGTQALTTILPLLNTLRGLGKKVLVATGDALEREARRILFDSTEHYVPIDTGQLHDAARVLPAQLTNDTVSVTFGYDGVANERGSMYTIPVHEIPEPPSQSIGGRSARHPRGEWRYLLTPFLKALADLESNVVSSVLKATGP